MRSDQVTPTNEEKILDDNDFIVSKTDKRGVITYCNEIFMDMAQYTEQELLGQNHNIIRHPEMPRIAFKVAWDLIQSGKEFFGFVKNLRKNGGYYWVFANISADYDKNSQIIGFTSIRRKPNAQALKTIIPLYKELLQVEKQSGMNGSYKIIENLLAENNMQYNELIVSLQGNQ